DIAQRKLKKKREEEEKRKLLEEKKRKDEEKRKLLEEKKRKKEEKRKEQEKNRREQEKKLKDTLERQKKEMLESQKKLENQLNEIENIESSDEKLLSIIDELKLKISAKIKSNVIYPPNIDNKISAIFEVKVSITGDVLEVVLKEPSGNVYFDNAIESAIYVSSPLPITDNYEMYKRYFQKFDLYFSPEE
ncbi:MAG: TonB C-terminal domain-containing protein, partial [Hydrogenophilales bacterium]